MKTKTRHKKSYIHNKTIKRKGTRVNRNVYNGNVYNENVYNGNVYNQEDYSSNDGFLTSIWGPAIWHFLHTISFNYPVEPTKEHKRNYYNFIYNLKNILPCKKCRINLIANFKTLPLTMKNMKNRETFSLYVYQLHELINTMLHKKSGLTYEDVRERYEHFRARDCDKPNSRQEKGCSNPLYGKKTKCVIKIVPYDTKIDTFTVK